MKESTTFSQILSTRNEKLSTRLQDIRERAQEDWIHWLTPDMGSHAGYIHLRNVERTADKLVPEEAKHAFSDGEIFLLLTAILLHDVGRLIPENAPAQGAGALRCQGEKYHHACGSKRLLDEQWALFGLPDAHIAAYCALLAYSHRLDDPLDKAPSCLQCKGCVLQGLGTGAFRDTSLEPYGRLRIPLLAAILRISDEAENHWNRAIRDNYYEIYLRSGEQLYKAFRRCIEDVEFRPDDRCIVMHIPKFSDDDPQIKAQLTQSLADTGGNMRKVLKKWNVHLAQIGVQFDHIFFEREGLWYADHFGAFEDFPSPEEMFDADEVKEALGLMDALIHLAYGSLQYPDGFTLSEIASVLGHRLSNDRELPLLGRLTRMDSGIQLRDGCFLVEELAKLEALHKALENAPLAALEKGDATKLVYLVDWILRDRTNNERSAASISTDATSKIYSYSTCKLNENIRKLIDRVLEPRKLVFISLDEKTCYFHIEKLEENLKQPLVDYRRKLTLVQAIDELTQGALDEDIVQLSDVEGHLGMRFDERDLRILTELAKGYETSSLTIKRVKDSSGLKVTRELGQDKSYDAADLHDSVFEAKEPDETMAKIQAIYWATLRYEITDWETLEAIINKPLDANERKMLVKEKHGFDERGDPVNDPKAAHYVLTIKEARSGTTARIHIEINECKAEEPGNSGNQ